MVQDNTTNNNDNACSSNDDDDDDLSGLNMELQLLNEPIHSEIESLMQLYIFLRESNNKTTDATEKKRKIEETVPCSSPIMDRRQSPGNRLEEAKLLSPSCADSRKDATCFPQEPAAHNVSPDQTPYSSRPTASIEMKSLDDDHGGMEGKLQFGMQRLQELGERTEQSRAYFKNHGGVAALTMPLSTRTHSERNKQDAPQEIASRKVIEFVDSEVEDLSDMDLVFLDELSLPQPKRCRRV